MKRWIPGSFIGAIIVFAWQALSWMVLPTHKDFGKYTPQQENILNAITSGINEDGHYMLPTVPKDASMEEMEKVGKAQDGKPMAMIVYNSKYEYGMTMPMIRGFLVNLFLVFTLIYIITRGGVPTFTRTVAASVAAGLFAWLWGPYMSNVWYQAPFSMISGQLVDSLVAWGLCGLWLGWYLNRARTPARV